jgi:hypothetical protein
MPTGDAERPEAGTESAIWLPRDWVECLGWIPSTGLPMANDHADLRINMY